MVKIKKRTTANKATRKASTKKRFFKKVQHDDAEVAKHWDFRKTREANMRNMGLAHDVNRAVKGLPGATPSSDHRAQQTVKLELVDIPQSDDLSTGAQGINERRSPMSEEKQKYVVKLMTKYGDDTDKMAKDIKRNPQQFTSAKLKKMISRYNLLTDKQRLVPPPQQR